MDIQEALNILGLKSGASNKDVKKAFRQKAIQFHPDRNKAIDAGSKFKKVNEASQLLTKCGTVSKRFVVKPLDINKVKDAEVNQYFYRILILIVMICWIILSLLKSI
jgi:hypothetical protein